MKLDCISMRRLTHWIAIAITLSLIVSLNVQAQITQEQKIVPSDSISRDFFGDSVSLSGNRVVIGAPGNDDNGFSSGSAYVFERLGDRNWQEVVKLLASDGENSDNFGQSVAMSGDRLAVGTPGEGCDRAIPKILSDGIALVDGSERERMGLPARGAFGEMVDMFTTAMFTLRKPLHDPSYANQDPVDNDL